ncbi:MAG: type IV pilus assembly protein PilM, partial [Clostridia bacterium]|nr:type IV pilus assembly protein PilM [Clostridia bacterium]
VAQVRKNKNNDLTIINYGIGDTPKGCIKNGAIGDQARVIERISKIISEHELNAKEAKIVISGTNIITRIIMVEKVPEAMLDKKVWDEIHACLPINLDEHEVDYKVLGDVREGNNEKIKIFVTAVPKKIISSYIEILKKLNLKPIAVDIPANSVSKFFQKDIIHEEHRPASKVEVLKGKKSNSVAVLDMGSETTIVNVLKNKVPEFNRVILMGSSNIDALIFKGLDMEKGQEEKAELYKRTYGIVSKRDYNNDLEWKCSEITKGFIDQLVKQIRTSFDFYVSRCNGEPVSKIFLVGGGSQLKGVTKYFEEAFEVPTYQVKVLDISGIKFQNNLDVEKINYLINALGIAL